METLSIKSNDAKSTLDFIRIGDLDFFEGPLTSLFLDFSHNHLYLFDWVDRDKKSNRWLVYRVHANKLWNYLNGEISFDALFSARPDEKFYFIDIEYGKYFSDYNLNELNSIPETYFPNKEQYFDSSSCPNKDKIIRFVTRYKFNHTQENELNTDLTNISNFLQLSFDNFPNKLSKLQHSPKGHIVYYSTYDEYKSFEVFESNRISYDLSLNTNKISIKSNIFSGNHV